MWGVVVVMDDLPLAGHEGFAPMRCQFERLGGCCLGFGVLFVTLQGHACLQGLSLVPAAQAVQVALACCAVFFFCCMLHRQGPWRSCCQNVVAATAQDVLPLSVAVETVQPPVVNLVY